MFCADVKEADVSSPLSHFRDVKGTHFFPSGGLHIKNVTPASLLARMIRLPEMLALAKHSSGSILRKLRETRDYFSYNFSPSDSQNADGRLHEHHEMTEYATFRLSSDARSRLTS